MAEAVNRALLLRAAGLVLALAGCAASVPPGPAQQQRDLVRRDLQGLEQGLRAGTWSRVERFFSPAFHEGYGELRDHMERRFRDEQITDLQFTVNRVLETDGLLNAQVRWNKAWIDRKTGKPARASGTSEFILQPDGQDLRILRIGGDRFF